MRCLATVLTIAAAACSTAKPRPVAQRAEAQATRPTSGAVEVEDAVHGVRYELPPSADGWQAAREGNAHIASGVQVEVASFPMSKATGAGACRDFARTRLSTRTEGEGETDGPRDQTIGDAPSATWSFTRGPSAAPVRSRWAFFSRGADCLMLEVSGPRGDAFAESTFDAATRRFEVLELPVDRQREVDLLAGMGFLERRDPVAALERFEALTRREPGFAKAHFGALMAGFEIGAPAYARALPHGEAALKAEHELTAEQRQLALRAVGVMQLAENRVQNAVETLAELVVRVPDLAEGQYNYACALARHGDVDGAIEHLATAVRIDGDLAAHARDDEDLKILRSVRRFQQLVTSPPAPPPPSAERK